MREALEKLYRERYTRYTQQLSNRVGGIHNAEDVVQEAFARALQYEDSYDSKRDLASWFSSILKNAQRDFLREQRLLGMSLTNDEPDEEITYDKLDDSNLLRRIEKELEEYDEPNRSILKLMFVKNYKAIEVTHIIPNTNNRSIAVLAHRFRNSMKEKYGAVL